MISELEPIWRQLQETYAALRDALAEVPDGRLHWKPGPAAKDVSWMIQHLTRGNIIYAHFMEHGTRGQHPEIEERASRQQLVDRLACSEEGVRESFERMTTSGLWQSRADGWSPLGPAVEGPLDGHWFALQMVRHSAYHLGQINVYLLMWEGEAAG